MTTTTDTPPARRSVLDRPTAMRLAATEYERFAEQLRQLGPTDWAKPTDCPDWDVRAVAAHTLGMAEMAASIRESRRQTAQATKRGGVFLDSLTALQVDKHRALTPEQIVTGMERVGPKAARGRRRAPAFIRRRTMPQLQSVGGVEEQWTFGFLIDSILTRDPWMHRVDIARATGRELHLTPDHDGVLVADVVTEWAARHGQSYALHLFGPAGGRWSASVGGPELELDAIDFARVLSGRGAGEGLLAVQVPF